MKHNPIKDHILSIFIILGAHIFENCTAGNAPLVPEIREQKSSAQEIAPSTPKPASKIMTWFSPQLALGEPISPQRRTAIQSFINYSPAQQEFLRFLHSKEGMDFWVSTHQKLFPAGTPEQWEQMLTQVLMMEYLSIPEILLDEWIKTNSTAMQLWNEWQEQQKPIMLESQKWLAHPLTQKQFREFMNSPEGQQQWYEIERQTFPEKYSGGFPKTEDLGEALKTQQWGMHHLYAWANTNPVALQSWNAWLQEKFPSPRPIREGETVITQEAPRYFVASPQLKTPEGASPLIEIKPEEFVPVGLYDPVPSLADIEKSRQRFVKHIFETAKQTGEKKVAIDIASKMAHIEQAAKKSAETVDLLFQLDTSNPTVHTMLNKYFKPGEKPSPSEFFQKLADERIKYFTKMVERKLLREPTTMSKSERRDREIIAQKVKELEQILGQSKILLSPEVLKIIRPQPIKTKGPLGKLEKGSTELQYAAGISDPYDPITGRSELFIPTSNISPQILSHELGHVIDPLTAQTTEFLVQLTERGRRVIAEKTDPALLEKLFTHQKNLGLSLADLSRSMELLRTDPIATLAFEDWRRKVEKYADAWAAISPAQVEYRREFAPPFSIPRRGRAKNVLQQHPSYYSMLRRHDEYQKAHEWVLAHKDLFNAIRMQELRAQQEQATRQAAAQAAMARQQKFEARERLRSRIREIEARQTQQERAQTRKMPSRPAIVR